METRLPTKISFFFILVLYQIYIQSTIYTICSTKLSDVNFPSSFPPSIQIYLLRQVGRFPQQFKLVLQVGNFLRFPLKQFSQLQNGVL